MNMQPNTMSDRRPRLHHMDVLKGMAIFMVVMGHVLTMCVRDVDRAALFKFVGEIHMPVFFFISGWFTLKLVPTAGGRMRWRVPALWPRCKRLLLPMLVMSSLWVIYFPHSGLQSPLDSTFEGLWFSEYKNGYWFTYVLFQIVVIYAALAGIFSRITSAAGQILATIAVWALLIVISQMMPGNVNSFISFIFTVRFFPVFMAGAIAAAHSGEFGRLLRSSSAYTLALLIGAVLLYFICWPWEFENLHIHFGALSLDVDIARSIFQILLAYVAIAAVQPWCEKAFGPDKGEGSHRFAKAWQYLGRESLTIYLLHYFFLFPMGLWRDELMAMNLSFVPTLVFSAFWAAIIIAVVLGFNRLILPSRLLSFLMAGRETKSPKSIQS